jgi:tetratricopeptide (TPR) repeat protein
MLLSREPAGVSAPCSPYPRPRWLDIPRIILAFSFLGSPLYPVLLNWALARHTLLTTDRSLLDPRNLLWYVPLTLAGGWAFFDGLREARVLRARARDESRKPIEQYWQRRLAAARAKGDRQAELEALSNVGFWPKADEHYAEAAPHLEETLSLGRTLGNHPFEEERALYGLGMAAFERGDQDAAEELFRQSQDVAKTLDRRDELADVYAHVGELLWEYRGKREEGCQLLAQAQAIYHEIAQSKPPWRAQERHMRDLRRKYGNASA